MLSSIQSSSVASCSGLKPTAPRTPKPPALLTAATTSRQWVKAKMGNSIPRRSQSSVCMLPMIRGRARTRSMGMPTDVGAIDLMMGVRAGQAARAQYDYLRRYAKDDGSKGMEFVAEYMFKDVPYSAHSRE